MRPKAFDGALCLFLLEAGCDAARIRAAFGKFGPIDAIELAADASQADAMSLAMAQENIAKFVGDEADIKKIIYVPGKILNVVAPPAKK